MIDNSPIKPDCPCTEECERHGNCKACREYHKNKGDRSYCKSSDSSTGENTLSEHQNADGHHHNHIHGDEHGLFGHEKH